MQVFINFANFYKRFVHAFFKTNAKLISLLKESEKRENSKQIRHDFKSEKIQKFDQKNLHERVDVTALQIRWSVDDENKSYRIFS